MHLLLPHQNSTPTISISITITIPVTTFVGDGDLRATFMDSERAEVMVNLEGVVTAKSEGGNVGGGSSGGRNQQCLQLWLPGSNSFATAVSTL